MIKVDDFKSLLGKHVIRILLMVWPPEGEEDLNFVDISVCFEFLGFENTLHIVTTEIEDNWTPVLMRKSKQELVKVYPWTQYKNRIKRWIKQEMQEETFDYEFFDFSECPSFNLIMGARIESIELANITGEFNPFGVKICFPKDSIFSCSNVDGNTIETSLFNRHFCLSSFSTLGEIEFLNINSVKK